MKTLRHMDIALALLGAARSHMKAAEDDIEGLRPPVLSDPALPTAQRHGYSASLHMYLESWGSELETIADQLKTETLRRREDRQVRLR